MGQLIFELMLAKLKWPGLASRLTTVLCLPLLVLILCSGASCGDHSAEGQKQNDVDQSELTTDTIVYVTDTGEKYHKDDCRYLKESKTSISISEAIRQGYEPCKVCKPRK